MRIVCLCNNWAGWQAAECLRKQGEEIVALVLHPRESAKYASKILEVVGKDCLIVEARNM